MATVRGGSARPCWRASKTWATVTVRQPAAESAAICLEKRAGGTTRPGRASPACAGSTIRWYIRIGTWRAKPAGGTNPAIGSGHLPAAGDGVGTADALEPGLVEAVGAPLAAAVGVAVGAGV